MSFFIEAFQGPERSSMAKRGKAVRKPPTARKGADNSVRVRQTSVDAKKTIEA